MMKTFVLACLAVLTLSTAAKADDWFDRYDRDHNKQWNYQEFKRAHNDYWKHHRNEERWNEAKLHSQFNTWASAHPGYVEREQVREFHHWDH